MYTERTQLPTWGTFFQWTLLMRGFLHVNMSRWRLDFSTLKPLYYYIHIIYYIHVLGGKQKEASLSHLRDMTLLCRCLFSSFTLWRSVRSFFRASRITWSSPNFCTWRSSSVTLSSARWHLTFHSSISLLLLPESFSCLCESIALSLYRLARWMII